MYVYVYVFVYVSIHSVVAVGLQPYSYSTLISGFPDSMAPVAHGNDSSQPGHGLSGV